MKVSIQHIAFLLCLIFPPGKAVASPCREAVSPSPRKSAKWENVQSLSVIGETAFQKEKGQNLFIEGNGLDRFESLLLQPAVGDLISYSAKK